VNVLSVDGEKKRISLSIRQALEDEEIMNAEAATEPEAEYEVVATDDSVAETVAEAVEAVEATAEAAAEAIEEKAEAVEEAAEAAPEA